MWPAQSCLPLPPSCSHCWATCALSKTRAGGIIYPSRQWGLELVCHPQIQQLGDQGWVLAPPWPLGQMLPKPHPFPHPHPLLFFLLRPLQLTPFLFLTHSHMGTHKPRPTCTHTPIKLILSLRSSLHTHTDRLHLHPSTGQKGIKGWMALAHPRPS